MKNFKPLIYIPSDSSDYLSVFDHFVKVALKGLKLKLNL